MIRKILKGILVIICMITIFYFSSDNGDESSYKSDYFILGIALVSFLREFSISIQKLLLLSIFLAFLYACSDEVHQLFIPGRTGRAFDVFIDTLGASSGVLLYYLLFRKKLKEVRYEQKERTC